MKKNHCQGWVNSQIISNFSKCLCLFVLLSCFNFGLQAQNLNPNTTISPKSEVGIIAQNLGLTTYAYHSWNLDKVKTVLKQKYNLTGTSTSIDRFKKAYYEMNLVELDLDVAPQISTIKLLKVLQSKVNDSSITDAVLRSIYNDLVVSF